MRRSPLSGGQAAAERVRQPAGNGPGSTARQAPIHAPLITHVSAYHLSPLTSHRSHLFPYHRSPLTTHQSPIPDLRGPHEEAEPRTLPCGPRRSCPRPGRMAMPPYDGPLLAMNSPSRQAIRMLDMAAVVIRCLLPGLGRPRASTGGSLDENLAQVEAEGWGERKETAFRRSLLVLDREIVSAAIRLGSTSTLGDVAGRGPGVFALGRHRAQIDVEWSVAVAAVNNVCPRTVGDRG